ncbi:MAG: histidine kinase dimerization/phospho-acceptor domain-containing protein [Erythrobacter sp.]
MFFDDRLATVLRHRAAGEHAARTQFRQLLDLLGSRKYGRDESLVAAAWLRLGALGEQIPAAERAAMIRETGWRFRSAELAAHLAEDEPEVVSAALSRADLTDDDWQELIPRLPIRARGFLRHRRNLPAGAGLILDRLGITDRALPLPEAADEDLVLADDQVIPNEDFEPEPEPENESEAEPLGEDAGETVELESAEPAPAPASSPVPAQRDNEKTEISALVERIAQFRKERENPQPSSEIAPQLPLEEGARSGSRELSAFAFSTDAAGRIDWADETIAPMVVGKRLMPRQTLGAQTALDQVSRAFLSQLPIEGGPIALEGADLIAGEWIVDAHPRFAATGGRFFGYVGRCRRPAPEDREGAARSSEADRIRQLLHELRTPVNALQGFAEVIQQQLFGPAPNEYRALAATIAGDAARILAGFDELERLARLESGAMILEEGTSDFGELAKRMIGQLQQVLAPRMAGFNYTPPQGGDIIATLGEEDAEALLWRVLATIAGACNASETLPVALSSKNGQVQMICAVPAQLLQEEDLFAAQVKPSGASVSAGLFGAGFSLRLARAEARSAGGELTYQDGEIRLQLPLLIEFPRLPERSQQENKRTDMQ